MPVDVSSNDRSNPVSSVAKTSRPPGATNTCVGDDFGGSTNVDPVADSTPSFATRKVV